ncbi:Auxin response factor 3-like protein [Drosera capensis]
MQGVFSVSYNPRSITSAFIVPLRRFLKSYDNTVLVGTRFVMRYEAEDSAEKRTSGVITGIGDVDPLRWPGSKWRCLVVRWDDIEGNHPIRVSPWEIEPSGTVPGCGYTMTAGLKRNRMGMPLVKPDFLIHGEVRTPDSGEPTRFGKVLQGQEIMGANAAHRRSNDPNPRPPQLARCFPMPNTAVGIAPIPPGDLLGEPLRFHKVLQGQETRLPPHIPCYGDRKIERRGMEILEGVKVPNPGSGWPAYVLKASGPHVSSPSPSTEVSSPSSVLMFHQASLPVSNVHPGYRFNHPGQRTNGMSNQAVVERYSKNTQYLHGRAISRSGMHYSGSVEKPSWPSSQMKPPVAYNAGYGENLDVHPRSETSCRLFGFSLRNGGLGGINKEGTPSPTMSRSSLDTSVSPEVEGPQGCQIRLRPAALTTASLGSNWTKVTELYHARDKLLDIAL